MEKFFNSFLKIPQPLQDNPSRYSKSIKRKNYFSERMDRYLRSDALTKRLKDPDLSPLIRIAQAPRPCMLRSAAGTTRILVPGRHWTARPSRPDSAFVRRQIPKHPIRKILLDYGTDPNSKDIGGRTPLSWAATPALVYGRIIEPRRIFPRLASANVDVIACLVVNGAEINCEDYEKRTPLIWVMTHIFIDTTQILSGLEAQ